MQSIYRTITADKLTESLIGAHVTMCGWVENIRDHGGVSFIDLRDFYGVVQVVMREKSLLDGIRAKISASNTVFWICATERSKKTLFSAQR